MNAITPTIHDLEASPAAGYAVITQKVDALLREFAPRSTAARMIIRAAALQDAHMTSVAETAQALRDLADEVEVM